MMGMPWHAHASRCIPATLGLGSPLTMSLNLSLGALEIGVLIDIFLFSMVFTRVYIHYAYAYVISF